MTDIPKVSPGDWVTIGEMDWRTKTLWAVVCHVYDEPSPEGGHIEVVYLGSRKQAISRHVRWTGTHWHFVEGEEGGYANKSRRLKTFVQTLRIGRK